MLNPRTMLAQRIAGHKVLDTRSSSYWTDPHTTFSKVVWDPAITPISTLVSSPSGVAVQIIPRSYRLLFFTRSSPRRTFWKNALASLQARWPAGDVRSRASADMPELIYNRHVFVDCQRPRISTRSNCPHSENSDVAPPRLKLYGRYPMSSRWRPSQIRLNTARYRPIDPEKSLSPGLFVSSNALRSWQQPSSSSTTEELKPCLAPSFVRPRLITHCCPFLPTFTSPAFNE